MQFQELVLPSLVRHDPKSLRLQAIICEICGTEAEFDPLEPGDFEHALNTLQHHKCKNQQHYVYPIPDLLQDSLCRRRNSLGEGEFLSGASSHGCREPNQRENPKTPLATLS